jgi:hypothetical protein
MAQTPHAPTQAGAPAFHGHPSPHWALLLAK